jgi:hypothetical protein
MIDGYAGLNQFINTKIMPSASWSGGMLSASAGLFSLGAGSDLPGAAKSPSSTTLAERYGVDSEMAKQIDHCLTKYHFAEDTTGANEEAKLCLRKCEDVAWGEAADYSKCILSIAENEGMREAGAAKLRADGYFAGSDIMSGKRGQEYFEQCWQREEVAAKIDFVGQTYSETDHDSVVLNYRKGALRVVLERIAQLNR